MVTGTAIAARLAAYACALALVFGLAWAAGRLVQHVPTPAGAEPEVIGPAPGDADSAGATDGLAVRRLRLPARRRRPHVRPGHPA